ncbi:MAG: prepilin-type N-terminal cleavage/methylation domain-containing protein [Planctomycetaceae bacterium]|jgi:hypothetical protein|nr:prepilin-type N-terminal cleavage/methylation domain-containing protein [Planctomycetaceae bacterium]
MKRSAYTLIELMMATAISLVLLLGVIEMFRSVAGMMHDTRSTLNMSANLEHTAAILRQDLALIPKSLAEKPSKITNGEDVSDMDGYLEIIDGNPVPNPYKEDETVGDVDDIIAFTTKPNVEFPFRGLRQGQVIERSQAEIIWFMRGTTLFRRIRLIDDQHVADSGIFSPAELAVRNNRYGHYGSSPHTVYNPHIEDKPNEQTAVDANYWLRLPTLEETLHDNWHADATWTATYTPLPTVPVDLWETRFPGQGLDGKSGSLAAFVQEPRHPRTGEDVILTNVIAFDIKVWDADKKQYTDFHNIPADEPVKSLVNVFDSWSKNHKNAADQVILPPYTGALTGIQITIRCFDPQSRHVKQVTVVHSFE